MLTAPTMRRYPSEERVSLDHILNGIPEGIAPCGPTAGATRPETGARSTGAH